MRHLISATFLSILLTACGGGEEDSAPTIADADSCAPAADGEEAATIDYSSDESSLTVNADTSSIDGQLNAIAVVGCVVDKLDGPSSIGDRVGATTGFGGPQSEEWGGFEANWSFSGASSRLLFSVDAK